MAHFAKINSDNIVEQVIVVNIENESEGISFIADTLQLSGTWVKTSYNTQAGIHSQGGTPLRKNYAAPGFTYDATRDAFIAPKPYPSWSLNEDSCTWVSPVPYPTSGNQYYWNEDTTSWVLFS